MKRDISTSFSAVTAIVPAVLTADNTPAAIDLQNFDAAMIMIMVGAGGITFDTTNKVEFKLTHSDDDSTYTAVTSGDISSAITVGTGGIVYSLIAAHASATVTKVGYHGGKKYLKLLADFSGTHGTGTPIAAVVVRAEPRVGPVA
jgi:hypothetical protein